MGNSQASITFGTCRVTHKKLIAEGGFGYVYQVEDDKGRQYAMKRVIVPIDDTERNNVALFEQRVLETLPLHPNIVQFCGAQQLDVLEKKQRHFCTLMEYCNGNVWELMQEYKSKNQKLPEPQICRIFRDACLAIHHLHSQVPPIAHRDLKVENLLIGADGNFKLTDFGSCTVEHGIWTTQREIAIKEEEISKHTTLAYRSPEQVDLYLRCRICEKVDIWALGVLLFVLLTEKTPFADQHGNVEKMGILNCRYRYTPDKIYNMCWKNFLSFLLNPNPTDRPSIHDVLAYGAELKSSGELQHWPDLPSDQAIWPSNNHNNEENLDNLTNFLTLQKSSVYPKSPKRKTVNSIPPRRSPKQELGHLSGKRSSGNNSNKVNSGTEDTNTNSTTTATISSFSGQLSNESLFDNNNDTFFEDNYSNNNNNNNYNIDNNNSNNNNINNDTYDSDTLSPAELLDNNNDYQTRDARSTKQSPKVTSAKHTAGSSSGKYSAGSTSTSSTKKESSKGGSSSSGRSNKGNHSSKALKGQPPSFLSSALLTCISTAEPGHGQLPLPPNKPINAVNPISDREIEEALRKHSLKSPVDGGTTSSNNNNNNHPAFQDDIPIFPVPMSVVAGSRSEDRDELKRDRKALIEGNQSGKSGSSKQSSSTTTSSTIRGAISGGAKQLGEGLSAMVSGVSGGKQAEMSAWIVKATGNTPGFPKAKHLRHIVVSLWESDMSVEWLLSKLAERPWKLSSIICCKVLVTLMKVMQQGPPNMLPTFSIFITFLEHIEHHWTAATSGGNNNNNTNGAGEQLRKGTSNRPPINSNGYATALFLCRFSSLLRQKLQFHSFHPEFGSHFTTIASLACKDTLPENIKLQNIPNILSRLLTIQTAIEIVQKSIFSLRVYDDGETHGSSIAETVTAQAALLPLLEESYILFVATLYLLDTLYEHVHSVPNDAYDSNNNNNSSNNNNNFITRSTVDALREQFDSQFNALNGFYMRCRGVPFVSTMNCIPSLPKVNPLFRWSAAANSKEKGLSPGDKEDTSNSSGNRISHRMIKTGDISWMSWLPPETQSATDAASHFSALEERQAREVEHVIPDAGDLFSQEVFDPFNLLSEPTEAPPDVDGLLDLIPSDGRPVHSPQTVASTAISSQSQSQSQSSTSVTPPRSSPIPNISSPARSSPSTSNQRSDGLSRSIDRPNLVSIS